MRLTAVFSLIALPFLVNCAPTSDAPMELSEAMNLQIGSEEAGYVLWQSPYGTNVIYRNLLRANGGCSESFMGAVDRAQIYAGFRCRFYRYVVMMLRTTLQSPYTPVTNEHAC